MNRAQRNKNRSTAAWLAWNSVICPECGERGRHYITYPYTLQDVIDGALPNGFWTCAKFYGPDGRREGAQS